MEPGEPSRRKVEIIDLPGLLHELAQMLAERDTAAYRRGYFDGQAGRPFRPQQEDGHEGQV